jgi:imidazole glycerol-phosphate synthase subunit HisH
MNQKIVIIDYGSGNLQSVLNAFIKINPDFDVKISNKAADLKTATHIILPGVGAFADCIKALSAIGGMIDTLKEEILINKKPFLGICVGMQLLANIGLEYGKSAGLGFIEGNVGKIDDQNKSLKIPHIGWNEVEFEQKHPILKNIKNNEHFYFVHSFKFMAENSENIIATTNYGQKITAIIAKNNIVATQFHPEKSSDAGLQILENFSQL